MKKMPSYRLVVGSAVRGKGVQGTILHESDESHVRDMVTRLPRPPSWQKIEQFDELRENLHTLENTQRYISVLRAFTRHID